MSDIARIAAEVIGATGVEVVVRGEDGTPSLVIPDGTPSGRRAEVESAFRLAVANEQGRSANEQAVRWLEAQRLGMTVEAGGLRVNRSATMELLTAVTLGGKGQHAIVDADGVVRQVTARQASDLLEQLDKASGLVLATYSAKRSR